MTENQKYKPILPFFEANMVKRADSQYNRLTDSIYEGMQIFLPVYLLTLNSLCSQGDHIPNVVQNIKFINNFGKFFKMEFNLFLYLIARLLSRPLVPA